MRRCYFLLPAAGAAILAILTLCGCMVLDPGGQSARSLKQWSTVTWGADGELIVKTHGPQTASWEMASGGTIVLTAGPDGNPVVDPSNSQPEYWFRSYPSADVAGAVAPVYAQQSTAQTELWAPALSQIMLRIVDLVEKLAAMETAASVEPG